MLKFTPMEPILATEIPQNDNWVHELKFDGIRGILIYKKGEFRLYSKSGNEILARFPEIIEFKEFFKGISATVDGELTVWKGDSHSFHDVLSRARSSTEPKIKHNILNYPLTYVMFDILEYNGQELALKPLLERKRILKDCVTQNNRFIYSDYYSNGKALFEKVEELGYEGIVSKKANSPYMPQKKHSFWYKIKALKKMLTVVGGVKLESERVKSILLGIYHGKELYFVGNVYSGLSQSDILLLSDNLKTLAIEQSPFVNLPHSKSTVFMSPVVTCWVKFLEWSNSGKLRHPQILGFSDLSADKANGDEYTA